jgi:hypothetical protein
MSDTRVEKNGKIEMNGFPLHECLRCRDISFGVTNRPNLAHASMKSAGRKRENLIDFK